MTVAFGTPADHQIGYLLKQVQASLRTVMDDTLSPLGITVPQYTCLRVLGRQPEASNAELARAAFVTRQSMNVVIRTLQARGLLSRPATPPRGRALPTQLTPQGRRVLREASQVVDAVEARMLSPLSTSARERLRRDLHACADALAAPAPRTRPGP